MTRLGCLIVLLCVANIALAEKVNPDSADARAKLHAAVVGAAVADAASVAYQGVFDQEELQSRFKHTGQFGPEFNDPVSNDYGYKSGDPSHYGRQYRFLLDAIVKTNGIVGSELATQTAEYIRQEKAAGRFVDRVSADLISNLEQGKAYPNAGSHLRLSIPLMKAPLVAALHGGFEDLERKCNELFQISQISPSISTTYGTMAAEIITLVAFGMPRDKAVKFVMVDHQSDEQIKQLHKVITEKVASSGKDVTASFKDSITTYGRSGNLPTSFKVAIHCILAFTNFKSALQANIMYGGDIPPRAMFIGAVFAAEEPKSIDNFWLSKTPDNAALSHAAVALLNARKQTKTSARHTEL